MVKEEFREDSDGRRPGHGAPPRAAPAVRAPPHGAPAARGRPCAARGATSVNEGGLRGVRGLYRRRRLCDGQGGGIGVSICPLSVSPHLGDTNVRSKAFLNDRCGLAIHPPFRNGLLSKSPLREEIDKKRGVGGRKKLMVDTKLGIRKNPGKVPSGGEP